MFLPSKEQTPVNLKRIGITQLTEKIIYAFVFIAGSLAQLDGNSAYSDVEKGAWQELKDKHFVVYYQDKDDYDVAKILLREAEAYYQKIGAQIGYTRYADFWTWEDRAKILLFHSQKSFVETTGQPPWTGGYADRDTYLFNSRVIVTYKQEQKFLDGLLPHEISHLILRDYISDHQIPMWFDEGVAQLQEPAKKEVADRIMRTLVGKGAYIPFAILMVWDIRREKDTQKVQTFYAQSLSVVEFLVETYGGDSFSRLCRYLRDGKEFEDALKAAYSNTLPSIEDLEHKWVTRMSR